MTRSCNGCNTSCGSVVESCNRCLRTSSGTSLLNRLKRQVRCKTVVKVMSRLRVNIVDSGLSTNNLVSRHSVVLNSKSISSRTNTNSERTRVIGKDITLTYQNSRAVSSSKCFPISTETSGRSNTLERVTNRNIRVGTVSYDMARMVCVSCREVSNKIETFNKKVPNRVTNTNTLRITSRKWSNIGSNS